MTVRVLAADDQPIVRAGLAGIIAATSGFAVVGEVATGAEAVAVAARTRPDVVLLDVRMPVMDGIEACRRITAAQPEVRVLMLTTFDLDEYVYDALRAGASGFLLKDATPEELISAVAVVAAGDALIAPRITRRLLHHFIRPLDRPLDRPPAGPVTGLDGRLTDRELQVLTLVGQGLTNDEIAAKLFITTATVKGHIRHLLTKLAARDRIHLVILAYRHGLATPD